MKRLSLTPISCSVLAVVGITAWCVLFLGNHGPLSLWCGRLSSANDPYLDGSGDVFQKGNWHFCNATRTWGETYGVKLNRFYLSLSVKHINPLVSPKEAREDD
jgi:hypothetical protein